MKSEETVRMPEHITIDVEIKADNLDELLAVGDAVARLNRELSRIAAQVDGRLTKDGWELGEGWKAAQ